ncbi:MAG TPA: hypothetical protein VGJ51_16360 [Candidatus Angelobacter sp.]
MRPPFTLRRVSWPQPIQIVENNWISDPSWDAPQMDAVPRWKLHLMNDTPCWMIDWRDHFRDGIKRWNPYEGGEMRGFHVVFCLEMHERGRLVFWDDDGSIIRRNGQIIHEDRSAHSLMQSSVEVEAGDVLEIAQWQLGWDWQWCAVMEKELAHRQGALEPFRAYRGRVQAQLQHPTGPPLKIYTNGSHPLRAIAAVYSMILNGYTPSSILLFGEEQWSKQSRALFAELLPFCHVFPQQAALEHIRQFGGTQLVEMARRHWFIMKACVALFMPPAEACLMDDDIFILDSVADALHEFSRCDLVYCPDQDLGDGYVRSWGTLLGHSGPLRTARFNAGLYWIRDIPNPQRLARVAVHCRPGMPFLWEQGLIAVAYATRATHQLHSQRYPFILFDGLPGGLYGYDYANNPCGYAAVHYGGLAEKPSDAFALQVLSDVLERCRNPVQLGVSVG